MPQILLVMCWASKIDLPRSIPSKNRGDSTMSKRQVSSLPSFRLMTMFPCPSTRVRYSTFISMFFIFILPKLPAFVIHVHFIQNKVHGNLVPCYYILSTFFIRVAHHAAASVANIAMVYAPRIASGLCHRTETGDFFIIHADVFIQFAFNTDRVIRYIVRNALQSSL